MGGEKFLCHARDGFQALEKVSPGEQREVKMPETLAQQKISRFGNGTYRLLLKAIPAEGAALPPEMRTSAPFALVDKPSFLERHPDVAEKYGNAEKRKAIALTEERQGAYACGYAYGRASAEAAANGALENCREHAQKSGAEVPCRILRIGAGPVAVTGQP